MRRSDIQVCGVLLHIQPCHVAAHHLELLLLPIRRIVVITVHTILSLSLMVPPLDGLLWLLFFLGYQALGKLPAGDTFPNWLSIHVIDRLARLFVSS